MVKQFLVCFGVFSLLIGVPWTLASYNPASVILDANGVAVTSTLNAAKQSLDVNVSGSSLPSGAATAAKQPALGTAGTASSDVVTIQGIASMTAIKVDGSAVTQPVSAASLPLPSGAATSAKQDTGNTSLASIDGKLPSTLGQKAMASSLACVLASDQSAIPASQSGSNWSMNVAQINGVTPLMGAGNTGTGSPRVTIASDQAAVAVKPSNGATGSGSAASATVSTVVTLSKPSNAIGFILMNLDTSTANVRWALGRTATTALGQQLQPGRDTGFIPAAIDVSLVAESGTQNYDIQWIAQ